MSDLKEFKLPDVGEGLTEADIVRWHVQPGDQIAVNQIIVEIETAKAVVELPSPYAGTVASLLVPEGATADVGTPIISVEVGGGQGGSAPAQAVPAEAAVQREIAQDEDLVPAPPVDVASEPGMIGSPAPKAERQAVLVGYGVKLGSTTRRQRKNGAASTAPPAHAGALAKPPVRKLARDMGVDLAMLAGTGPGGSITRDDVQQAAASLAPVDGVPAAKRVVPAAGVREERIPIRGVRKHTAAAMAASAFTAPHVT
ncbi:MAG TPA: biotin/lipoyl-containing protein, partial [Streptosporangiaceae bacterium]|nr:biotin/lipoyl-containing protein [Streptosporangiaceae bacterium]